MDMIRTLEAQHFKLFCDDATNLPSAARLAAALDIDLDRLADLAGIDRQLLRSDPEGQSVQSNIQPIAKVLARAAAMGGGLERAIAWFNKDPLPPFGGKTGATVVEEGKAELLLEWLDALEDGAYG